MSKDSFKESKRFLITGTFKFSTEFISTFDLYSAAEKFVQGNKEVEMLSLRPSGQNLLAIDIRYDPIKYDPENAYHIFTHEIVKPFFEKELGGDYVTWWELHDTAYVVK